MYLLAIFRVLAGLWKPRRYRPELHYMRGPGPKWRAKHQPWLRFDAEAVPRGGQYDLSPVYVRGGEKANPAR